MADISLTQSDYSFRNVSFYSKTVPSTPAPGTSGGNSALLVSMIGQGGGANAQAWQIAPTFEIGKERYFYWEQRSRKVSNTLLAFAGPAYKDMTVMHGMTNIATVQNSILLGLFPHAGPTGYQFVTCTMNPTDSSVDDVWYKHRLWGLIEGDNYRYVHEVDTGDGVWRRVNDYLIENPPTPNFMRSALGFNCFQVAAAPTVTPTGITNVTTTATVTTSSAHGKAVGELINVSGAVEPEYNGTFVIASTPLTTTLTYVMASNPGGSATGTLVLMLDANEYDIDAVIHMPLTDGRVPTLPTTPTAIDNYTWSALATFEQYTPVGAKDSSRPTDFSLQTATTVLDQGSYQPLRWTMKASTMWLEVPVSRKNETRWDAYVRLQTGTSLVATISHHSATMAGPDGYEAVFTMSTGVMSSTVNRMQAGVPTAIHTENFATQPGFSYTSGEWVKISLLVEESFASKPNITTVVRVASDEYTSSVTEDATAPANWLVPRGLSLVFSATAGHVVETQSIRRSEL